MQLSAGELLAIHYTVQLSMLIDFAKLIAWTISFWLMSGCVFVDMGDDDEEIQMVTQPD